MTTISAARPDARTAAPAKAGVVLAVLQGVGNIGLAVSQWSLDSFGLLVNSVMVIAGVLALALAVPVWRGTRWAARVVAIALVIAALGGLPAFFFPGVPAGWVIAAAAGIVLAVLTAVLLLMPRRR
jgi:hypothetical protein